MNEQPQETTLALTMGDPTGIGPEVIVKALSRIMHDAPFRVILVGDREIIIDAARRFAGSSRELLEKAPVFVEPDYLSPENIKGAKLVMLSLSSFEPAQIIPGQPGKDEGRAMREYIEAAVGLVRLGRAHGLATGPINKEAMLAGGSRHGGHTELIAELAGEGKPVMLLDSGALRVSLVTAHLPLAKVAGSLTVEEILRVIEVTGFGLERDLGVAKPRLAVAGLNPHAGEKGNLGTEEQDLISPAINQALQRGLDVKGPYPPDSIFPRAYSGEFDAVVCMHHDQGLIPLKFSGFDQAVNITLGLPIVRTSVGHGTGADIAGLGVASENSMLRALCMAYEIVQRRRTWQANI